MLFLPDITSAYANEEDDMDFEDDSEDEGSVDLSGKLHYSLSILLSGFSYTPLLAYILIFFYCSFSLGEDDDDEEDEEPTKKKSKK